METEGWRERGMERERGNKVLFIVFVGSLRDTTLVTTLLPVSTSQERRRGGRGTSGGPVSRAESKESWTEHLVLFHASPYPPECRILFTVNCCGTASNSLCSL